MESTPSGLAAVGDLHWGDHFCQFYETADDLRDSLVPYFKAGLENNERCLWITAEPFRRDDATAALRAAMPHLDRLLANGQIEIRDFDEWYVQQGSVSPEQVLHGWLHRVERALADGYKGLRITGNTFFLQAPTWRSFEQYEALVNRAFRSERVVALCSYCAPRCGASEVIDVVRNHQFALARRGGEWEVIENASLKIAKDELIKANAALEDRVRARTAELTAALHAREAALAEKDVLFREIHHRVKNNLQVVMSLLSIRARAAKVPQIAETLSEVGERVRAMGLVHQEVYSAHTGAIDFRSYLAKLCEGLIASYGLRGKVRFAIEADGGQVDLSEAVPLALLTTEIASNALKHAFDGRDGGNA